MLSTKRKQSKAMFFLRINDWQSSNNTIEINKSRCDINSDINKTKKAGLECKIDTDTDTEKATVKKKS